MSTLIKNCLEISFDFRNSRIKLVFCQELVYLGDGTLEGTSGCEPGFGAKETAWGVSGSFLLPDRFLLLLRMGKFRITISLSVINSIVFTAWITMIAVYVFREFERLKNILMCTREKLQLICQENEKEALNRELARFAISGTWRCTFYRLNFHNDLAKLCKYVFLVTVSALQFSPAPLCSGRKTCMSLASLLSTEVKTCCSYVSPCGGDSKQKVSPSALSYHSPEGCQPKVALLFTRKLFGALTERSSAKHQKQALTLQRVLAPCSTYLSWWKVLSVHFFFFFVYFASKIIFWALTATYGLLKSTRLSIS